MTYTHIAHDIHGIAIFAVGTSADDAISRAIDEAGPMFDAYGDGLSVEVSAKQFVAMQATPALIARVQELGGMIAWGSRDGVACTVDEEEAANA